MVRALAGDSTITSALGNGGSSAGGRGCGPDPTARRPDTIPVRWWACQYPGGPWKQTALVTAHIDEPLVTPWGSLTARGAEEQQPGPYSATAAGATSTGGPSSIMRPWVLRLENACLLYTSRCV